MKSFAKRTGDASEGGITKLLKVIEHISIYPEDYNEDHMFFALTYDSNQTLFEKKSNQLKIGVVAKSKTVGLVLLFLLRLIIDNNYDLANLALEDEEMNKGIDYFISVYEKYEEEYLIIPKKRVAKNKLQNGDVYTSENADLWSLEKIKKYYINV